MEVVQESEPFNSTPAEHFLKIQLSFINGLSLRLAEIQNAVDDQQRYVALHRLAGAAGGYGFANLGDIARASMQAMHSDSKSALNEQLALLDCAVHAVIRKQINELPLV